MGPKIFGSDYQYSVLMEPKIINFSIKVKPETLGKLGHLKTKNTHNFISYSIFNKNFKNSKTSFYIFSKWVRQRRRVLKTVNQKKFYVFSKIWNRIENQMNLPNRVLTVLPWNPNWSHSHTCNLLHGGLMQELIGPGWACPPSVLGSIREFLESRKMTAHQKKPGERKSIPSQNKLGQRTRPFPPDYIWTNV